VDRPVIGILTDFGDEDFFVASLKAVIAQINPAANVIDITHRIPSFNVLAGCFMLYAAYRYFPQNTIFLAVVDPGVGSSRKILCVETHKYFFIGPDNGVLTMALDNETVTQIIEVTEKEYFLPHLTSTFEARDKMAPVAAWLSKGIPCEKFGPEIVTYHKLDIRRPKGEGNNLVGRIIYIDKFGNMITNIPTEMLAEKLEGLHSRSLRLRLMSGTPVDTPELKGLDIIYRKTYDEAENGEVLCLPGSIGFLEIAVREGSASESLKANVGDGIVLTIKTET
jgi:S-adenosylmethionine hydrolase